MRAPLTALNESEPIHHNLNHQTLPPCAGDLYWQSVEEVGGNDKLNIETQIVRSLNNCRN